MAKRVDLSWVAGDYLYMMCERLYEPMQEIYYKLYCNPYFMHILDYGAMLLSVAIITVISLNQCV